MNLLESLAGSHVDGTWSAHLFPFVRTYTFDWMLAAYETRGRRRLLRKFTCVVSGRVKAFRMVRYLSLRYVTVRFILHAWPGSECVSSNKIYVYIIYIYVYYVYVYTHAGMYV